MCHGLFNCEEMQYAAVMTMNSQTEQREILSLFYLVIHVQRDRMPKYWVFFCLLEREQGLDRVLNLKAWR